MPDPEQTLKALGEASATIIEYAGSDVSVAAIKLLDTLATSYMHDLSSVQPDGLIRLQAALRQVNALRDLFKGGQGLIPKI